MQKQRFSSRSLYVTLGSIIIATVMLVMSIQLVVNYFQINERLTSELKAEVHQSALYLAENLSPFMDAYAVTEYQNLVRNEIKHKNLLSIIVSDHNMAEITGTVHYKTGFIQTHSGQFSEYDSNNKTHNALLNNPYFTDTHNIIGASGELIGGITFYVSDQQIQTALDALVLKSAINILIISFSLTLLLFLAIRQFLLSPLSKTISLIEQTDDSGIPTHEIKVSGPTEITQLTQTINTMLQTIKTSKTALAESEFRWKFAVDGRGDGLWDWNLTDNSIYYSPQCKILLGLNPSDPLDTLDDWKTRIHLDDRSKLDAAIQKHLAGQTPLFDCEHRIYGANQQIVWIHNRGTTVERSETGTPLRMIGTLSDITDRIQAQQALKRAHRINKLIIETIPDLLWLKDNDGYYLLCNSRFEQFFGAKEQDIIGKTDYDFVDQELADFFRKNDLHAIKAGKAVHNKERITFASNGYQGLFEATKVPLISNEGHVIGVLGISHDITESDRLIHQLSETKQALEHIAKHDSLTGLPNRYLFNELIQTVMYRCDRNTHLMALLYLDLDGFKEVNDCLGHEAGDQVLINVAEPLKAALLRKEDLVARLGGDEFVIAIADLSNQQELIPILKRLLDDLHQTLPYEHNGTVTQLEVTASIGITLYPQPKPINLDELLHQADQAMYQAKNSGKNQYYFYDDIPTSQPNA